MEEKRLADLTTQVLTLNTELAIARLELANMQKIIDELENQLLDLEKDFVKFDN